MSYGNGTHYRTESTEPGVVIDALTYISPDLARGGGKGEAGWVNILMSIKAGLGDTPAAEGIARQWSESSEKFDPRAFSSTWSTLSADGGIGAGTLFRVARENGWPGPGMPADPGLMARMNASRKPKARPAAPPEKASKAKEAPKLWKTLAAAGAAFEQLIAVGYDPESILFLLDGYGLDRDGHPNTWRVFDHPDRQLGRGVVYRGEAADGAPVFKFKTIARFERNGKLKRDSRFLFGAGGALVFEQPGAAIVIVGGEEKAAAAHRTGFAAISPLTGEKAPDEAWCKRIVTMDPPQVIIANDNDAAGEKANRETAAALVEAGYPPELISIITWPEDTPEGGDLNDVLKHGGPDALWNLLSSGRPYLEELKAGLPKTTSAAELQTKTFTPPKEIIRPYRPEGLSILAGRPKKGKSWAALSESIAVSSGGLALGMFETTAGEVLYLALEDSEPRMQSRMRTLHGDNPWPTRLHFAHTWPRLDHGGLDALRRWLQTHPGAAMVIADTFTRIRPPKGKDADSYQADSEATAALQRLALDFHVSIVLVLHQRKAAADDIFDSISGTLGLTGSADVISVLTRENKSDQGKLHLTGRDIEERTLAMTFSGGRWTCTGEADDETEVDPLAAAKDFLREALKSGPMVSDELFEQGKAQGLTKKKLYEAKDALGIKARCGGFQGKWTWCLYVNNEESLDKSRERLSDL